jgi:hypothetical protein
MSEVSVICELRMFYKVKNILKSVSGNASKLPGGISCSDEHDVVDASA